MIHETEGDILLSRAQLIAHGVSAMDPMNQGLAKSLHEQHPAMHKDFHHWCHQHHPKPGATWLWSGANGIRVANLITQNGGYGHGGKPEQANTRNVNHALKELAKIIVDEGITSVALPRLATGVGGLDWDEIKPLVEKHLDGLDIPVYLYTTYHAGQQAKEAGL